PLSGYAPTDAAAWKAWLKKHYGRQSRTGILPVQSQSKTVVSPAQPSAGQAGRLSYSADAPVPTPAARHAAPAGIFRDPATERALIDWAEFQQEEMAECVCELARAVRTASHGRKLVVFFYGYVFEFAAVSTGPSVAGHYALRRALNCPDIDVLCSPISYFDRGLAQSAPSMTAAESVALAKKMWLNEDDTHTYLATGTPPGSRDHVETLEDSNKQLVRNVAQEALRNFGTWWMDLGSSGWFNDASMWAEMKRLRALDEPLLNKPVPFRPQVAAVIDERAMLRVAAGGTQVTRPGIYEVREPLGRMGAPYGQYLLDDVLAGRVKAKLHVFLNAWSLSAAERAKLLKTTRGSAKVWCYAPGWFDGEQTSPEAMRQLTGFELKLVSPAVSTATPTERGRALGLEKTFGGEKPVKPLFAAADAKPEEILATYADGSAAVALRRTPGGPSLFVGAPGLTSELLRLAAREAGVHLFTETDCNVCANGRFLSLHASQDGPVAVNTGKPAPVTDVLSGEQVARGPRFTLPLKRGDTRVLGY
ncbi:MAG: hypothetical protein NTY01_22150, partial [Verrucomicrobia bacterium]|nr:hypothetical protein [Verrucomicrobiota bacterium]